ncbi:MAG: DUF4440 domain-containing protein [Rhizomicrobium sp.]|jgi:hypothetical protein
MDGTTSLLSILRELESRIYQPEIRRDRAKLDALAHSDFFEFGSSGARYSRSDILDLLPLDKSNNKVWAQDWAVQPLGDGFALLTFKSAHEQSDGTLERHTLRASIWALTAQGWQILFHQGTPSAAFEKAAL